MPSVAVFTDEQSNELELIRLRCLRFLAILCATLCVCGFGGVTTTPSIVLATVDQINGVWSLVPEIAVQNDGKWRPARLQDVWKGQQYRVFAYGDFRELGAVTIGEVNEEAEIPVSVEITAEGKGSPHWCFYFEGTTVSFSGIEKPITPESVDSRAAAEFILGKQGSSELDSLVKLDVANIRLDFPALATSQIQGKLTGDFDGNHQKDYVLILGDGPLSGPAAVVMYLQVSGSLKRVPIGFWKNCDENGWPALLFCRDVNFDGTEELFIADRSSDSDYPIVYSWSADGLQKVYEADVELSHGWQ